MGENADVRFMRGSLRDAFWRPAGSIYLCFCLAGMAAGLRHEKIVPHFNPIGDAAVPMLQTLTVAQVFFFLLVYPIVLMNRRSNCGLRNADCGLKMTPSALRTANYELLIEFLGMFLVTLPLYVLTAWLSDAAFKDALRAILTVAAVCPLSVLAGRLLTRPAWRSGAMLFLLVLVLGLPGVWYICVDFLYVRGDWALHLSPAVLAWTSAGSRQANWLPQPLWAWLAWPILAAAGGLCLWALPARNIESNLS